VNPRIQHCTITDVRGNGVIGTDQARGTLQDCRLDRIDKPAVALDKQSVTALLGCTIADCAEVGVYVTGGPRPTVHGPTLTPPPPRRGAPACCSTAAPIRWYAGCGSAAPAATACTCWARRRARSPTARSPRTGTPASGSPTAATRRCAAAWSGTARRPRSRSP